MTWIDIGLFPFLSVCSTFWAFLRENPTENYHVAGSIIKLYGPLRSKLAMVAMAAKGVNIVFVRFGIPTISTQHFGDSFFFVEPIYSDFGDDLWLGLPPLPQKNHVPFLGPLGFGDRSLAIFTHLAPSQRWTPGFTPFIWDLFHPVPGAFLQCRTPQSSSIFLGFSMT